MNTLSVFNPLRELDVLTNRLLSHGFSTRDAELRPWSPRVDITEDDTAYKITADLPEVPKDAVKVTVENGVITLRGERKWEKKTENTKVHLVERAYGTFSRSFRLPEDANSDGVTASYKDGVLTVIVAKREETKPKQVEVTID